MQDPDVEDRDTEIEQPTFTTSSRKAAGGRKTKTTITREVLADDAKERAPLTFGALFDPGPDDHNEELAIRVRVTRADPPEGMLGYIEDMDATEKHILDNWGGSTYRLDGLNSKGKIIRVKTLRLAGDPIFVSESADLQWRKQRGLPPRNQANGGMNATEILAMIETREAKRAAEDKERNDERRREEREADERRRREEREFAVEREKQAREWEDRKRRDDDERDRKRRQEDDDRERRRREDAAAAALAQQQHMQQMLQMVTTQASQSVSFIKDTVALQASKPHGSDSDMLIKGVQLALQLKDAAGGGEGEEDLLQTVVKNLPALLNGVGNAASKVVREIKGQPGEPAAAAQTTPNGGLVLPPGPASEKFAEVINRIAAAGQNPEVVLGQVADQLLAGSKKRAEQGKVAARPNAPVMDPGPPKPPTPVETPATAAPSTVSPQAPPAQRPSATGKVTKLKFGKPAAQ
jgi:hypothetical protein